ncbi:MAG: hypothetical protein PHR16_06555 [Methylovulum sp.]|nr:hypothetical protein [Methylovulum sp.]
MKILSAFGAILIANLTAGCAATPTGPSAASYGAGSDTAYLNASRGRADAQVTEAQVEQYRRQQAIVGDEMALEQQKRDNTLNNTRGILQNLQLIRGILPY